MPRRNFHLLWIIAVMAVFCYLRAGGTYGRRYGPMADAFVTALKEIQSRYLYPTDERQLFEGAMDGMVAELKDRNSAYMGRDATREFREQIEQEFGGIGIEVAWDRETNALTVMNPIVGTPAYEAGLISGDKIVKINDENTAEFTLPDAVRRLRGKPGDTVRLTVEREGQKDPIEMTIKRAIINVDTVLGDVRRRADGSWDYVLEEAPQFGYIRITQFGEKTTDEFERALEQLKEHNMKGLILDLRGNPGGLLESAKDVCDQFLKEGVIVRTKDRDQKIIEEYHATGNAKYADWPLAVLIDGDSASASEIVAGCLQDYDRAAIIGERSYGKGTVQTPLELEGGKSMMRLTIAEFRRPNDQNIHRRDEAKEDAVWGITPTKGYEVKLDDEKRLAIAKQRRKRDSMSPAKEGQPTKVDSTDDAILDDPTVEKAIEYLRSKVDGGSVKTSKAA